jgi:hypothetical protein
VSDGRLRGLVRLLLAAVVGAALLLSAGAVHRVEGCRRAQARLAAVAPGDLPGWVDARTGTIRPCWPAKGGCALLKSRWQGCWRGLI